VEEEDGKKVRWRRRRENESKFDFLFLRCRKKYSNWRHKPRPILRVELLRA